MAVTSMSNSSIGDFKKSNSMALGYTRSPWATRYVVVAGGGGGGRDRAGGGGGGGMLEADTAIVSGTTVTLTVGAGGVGATSGSYPTNGVNSVFFTFTCLGGGYGSTTRPTHLSANSGGSGGGGYGQALNPPTVTGGAGTSAQGNAGGNGANTNFCSGGGGGAGAVGQNGTGTVGGAGGAGLESNITGTFYAGGGGGARDTGAGGAGGSGGGGAAGGTGGNGNAGGANTGGGGGGGGNSAAADGGAGGSGVVVFTLPTAATATFSAGVTQTSAIVGATRVYTVTATSTTDETVTIS